MVFGLDSIFASKVKPYLADYFIDLTDENVDLGLKSVTMTNLQLRPDVLNQFKLPFTVYGTLGELSASLSVSWTLVTTLLIDIKDIYLLLVPETNAPFDPVADTERILDEKRKELKAFFANEIAKAEAEANKNAGPGAIGGFINGLINTLKLNIQNIHIRLEDSLTRPAHPYSAGLVLKSLDAESRNEDYEEGSSPTDDTFFKLVNLKGLGTYWNSNSTIISASKDTSLKAINEASNDLKRLLEENKDFHYFIGPLAATLKAMVTLKPDRLEHPYTLPKADVTLEMEAIHIGLTNLLFTDLAILGDTMDSMTRAKPFKKFRPTVPLAKGSYKLWWQFAYNSILVDVKRRKSDWSWERIKEHKKRAVKYGEEYYDFLAKGKNATDEDKESIQKLEDELDNFTLIIKKKEMEEKHKLKTDFVKDKEAAGSGWFSSVTVTPDEIQEFLKDNFTDEERKKLYDVVDYDPSNPTAAEPPACPKDWTELKFGFKLPRLGIGFIQLEPDAKVLDDGIEIGDFEADVCAVGFTKFPGVNGLRLTNTLQSIVFHGYGPDDKPRPKLLRTVVEKKDDKFIDFEYDKNPLDSAANTKIKLKVEQMEIIYDAATVQKLMDCFAIPPDVHLTSLKQAAAAAAEEMKKAQAERLKSMAKNTDTMDIDIKLIAPYVLIPEGGFLASYASVLILNLGNFEVECRPRDTTTEFDASKVEKIGEKEDEISPNILKLTYNEYEIHLNDFEVVLALPGENIDDVLKRKYDLTKKIDQPSPIIKTGDLVVRLDQCVISADPRFPKIRATLSIPLVDIEITDTRLLQLLRLVTTLPLPKSRVDIPVIEIIPPDPAFANPKPDLKKIDFSSIVLPVGGGTAAGTGPEELDPEKVVQFTDFMLDLNVERLKLGIWTLIKDSPTKEIRELLDFNINQASIKFKAKTYGIVIDAVIMSLTADYPSAWSEGGKTVYLLHTPASGTKGFDEKLAFVKVHMFSLAKDCPPKYMTLIKQKIGIEIAFLNVTLHQESLKELMGIGDTVSKEMAILKPPSTEPVGPIVAYDKKVSTIATKQGAKMKTMSVKFAIQGPSFKKGEVLLQLAANFNGLSIAIVSNTKEIAEIKLTGVGVHYEDTPLETTIKAELKTLEVNNLDTTTIYSKLLSLKESEQLVSANIILHKVTRAESLPETEISLTMGSPNVIVLGSFLGNLVTFGAALATPTATQAVKNAGAAAGAGATKAATAAAKYANASRIQLDITIDAPEILIPKDDSNLEALFANFGVLRLKNNLDAVKTGSKGERDAIVDELNFGLSGIKASRVLLDSETKKILTESYIVAPFSLGVDLQRNLSSGWYKEIPQFKVRADLQPISISAANDDLGFAIASFLNLAKGLAAGKPASGVPIPKIGDPEPDKDVPPPPPPVAAGVRGGARVLPVGKRGKMMGASIAVAPPKEESILIKLAADLSIQHVEFNSYIKSTPLAGQTGVVPRNPDDGLGHSEIKSIYVTGKMWANDDMEATVILQDIIFEDSRKTPAAIKNFIVRSTESNSTAPIIKASFKLTAIEKGVKSTSINLQTTALELILNMKYINLIAKYATGIMDSIPKPKKQIAEVEAKLQTIAETLAVEAVAVAETSLAVPGTVGAPAPPVPEPVPNVPPLIDADINIAGVRVIVLENAQSLETNAILLSVDANFLMKTENKISKGNGALHVQSFTSKYENQQFKPLAEIICPATLALEATIDPKKGIDVGLVLSDINVHFSAGTLLLVSKIATSFAAATKSNRVDELELEDFSNAWQIKHNDDEGYPFLAPLDPSELPKVDEEKKLAIGTLASGPLLLSKVKPLEENISLKSGAISLSIEVGAGVMATPLLLLEAHLNLAAANWTSNLTADGSLDFVVAYNNMSIGLWEYIVETVEIKNDGFGELKRKPWELRFNVTKPKSDPQNPKPLQVNLSAPDTLELTVSKSGIQVLSEIGKCFGVASTGIGTSERDVESAPFVLRNFSGSSVTVNIDKTAFYRVVNNVKAGGDLDVQNGESARFGLELSGIGMEQKGRTIDISIPEYNFKSMVDVSHERTRYFPLKGQVSGLTISIKTKDSSTYVILKGAIEVMNELEVPVDVLTSKKGSNDLIGTVKSGKVISVPVSTHVAGIRGIDGVVFKLQGFEATKSHQLTTLDKATSTIDAITTKAEGGGTDIFTFQLLGQSSETVLQNTDKVAPLSKNYVFTLKTPLVINNLLTVPLTLTSGAANHENTIAPGGVLSLTDSEAVKYWYTFPVKISSHEEHTWTSNLAFYNYDDGKDLNDIAFLNEKSDRTLYFKFQKVVANSQVTINIYAPYWMINHTGLDLSYRTYYYNKFETTQSGTETGPLMFAYEMYGTKNKCEVKVGANGSWGQGVNLDAMGLPMGYVCTVDKREYQFRIELASTGTQLTKTVTFLPRYIVTNTCPYPVILKEVDTDEELTLEADSAKPFWPHGTEKKFTVKVYGSQDVSAPIYYDRTADTLVKFNNVYGGIRSNINAKETKISIIFSEFSPHEVPLLFVNNTKDLKIDFNEVGSDKKITLEPGQSVNQTWTDPTREERGISWTPVGGTKHEDKTLKDASGKIELAPPPPADTSSKSRPTVVYKWFSFTNGIKRIFVFTDREEVIKRLELTTTAKDSPPNMEISMLIDGIGLSLVNNVVGKELIYAFVSSTDVIWEARPTTGGRYANFDETFTLILEHGYQNYISGQLTARPATLEGGIEIDFKDFSMTKPEAKSVRRRPYRAGVGLTLKLYPLGMDISLQLSRLQVDNQDPSAASDQAIIFAAVPQKNVAGTDTDAAPSVLIVSYRNMRASEKSQVHTVSGDIILQEFSLAANMGLIDDILDVLASNEDLKSQEQLMAHTYEIDHTLASVKSTDYYTQYVVLAKTENTVNIFESFKIYTLKFYLTFTVAGGHSGANPLKVLIMGLGAILANISKVHFSVDGFEVLRMRMSNDELVTEIVSHYKHGVIKNLYTLVLKLDVLGNPFKLLTGLGGGLASLLTDPVQGAMDGRFVGGVATGVGGLLDATVGNLTDSLSKITGSLGKGLEALHLRGLSDLVNVLSWGLGGVSKVTHLGTGRSEPVISKVRPPRTLEPGKVIDVFSNENNILNAMLKQVEANHKDAGPHINHLLYKDQLLLIHDAMALYLTVYPETMSAPSYNWIHKWKEFSDITPNAKNEVVFNIAAKGWGFTDTSLEVATGSPEMAKWLTAEANKVFTLKK